MPLDGSAVRSDFYPSPMTAPVTSMRTGAPASPASQHTTANKDAKSTEPTPRWTAPTLRRRVLCMIYESLLLFAVLFLAGYLFSTLTQQRNALMYRHLMQAWLFLVLGAYFVWFWCHGGQTLAMKTWKIRLVDARGGTPSVARAVARYLLAWLWVIPGVGLDWAFALKGWASVAVAGGWMAVWALTMRLDRHHQFLHDRLAGTQLVSVLSRP